MSPALLKLRAWSADSSSPASWDSLWKTNSSRIQNHYGCGEVQWTVQMQTEQQALQHRQNSLVAAVVITGRQQVNALIDCQARLVVTFTWLTSIVKIAQSVLVMSCSVTYTLQQHCCITYELEVCLRISMTNCSRVTPMSLVHQTLTFAAHSAAQRA